MKNAHLDPTKRHDFVYLFDVQDGNPNGDPDAGNLPRVDPETMQGLVTDVCLKRKIRDYVAMSNPGSSGLDIFVMHRSALNPKIQKAYENLGIDLEKPPRDEADGKKRNKKGEAQGSEIDAGKEWMCKHFFDVRTFGAVMSTGPKAGQVRGPMQLTFSRSIDPVVPQDLSITRVAVTRPGRPVAVAGPAHCAGAQTARHRPVRTDCTRSRRDRGNAAVQSPAPPDPVGLRGTPDRHFGEYQR